MKWKCQWKNGVVQVLGHWVGWGEDGQTRVWYSLIKIQHFIVTIVSKMTFNFIEVFIHRKCVLRLYILFTLLYYPLWYSGAMKISLFFIQSCKFRKSVVHFFIQVVYRWTTTWIYIVIEVVSKPRSSRYRLSNFTKANLHETILFAVYTYSKFKPILPWAVTIRNTQFVITIFHDREKFTQERIVS